MRTLYLLLLSVAAAVPAGWCFVAAAAEGSAPSREAYDTGWSLFIDNDSTGIGNDQNYTGGIGLAVSGQRARDLPVSLDPALGALNRLFQVPRIFPEAPHSRFHIIEFGLGAFTPENITRSEPIRDDHPYACLPYVSSSRQDVFPAADVSYHTTLMVGVLGTDICKTVQRTVHDITGSAEPRGWGNQISQGGEPTARWSITRHQPLYLGVEGKRRGQLTGNLELAAGLTTHIGLGANWRWGRIRSPWWTHAPNQAEYIGLGTPTPAPQRQLGSGRELYLWAGGMIRYRFYNGLLQGQFRDSEVTLSRSDLNPLVGEIWLGATADVSPKWQLSLVLRSRTREIDLPSVEYPFWAGLVLHRTPSL